MKIVKSAYRQIYWLPKWINCVTWRPGDPKIYKWLWWHFVFEAAQQSVQATAANAADERGVENQ